MYHTLVTISSSLSSWRDRVLSCRFVSFNYLFLGTVFFFSFFPHLPDRSGVRLFMCHYFTKSVLVFMCVNFWWWLVVVVVVVVVWCFLCIFLSCVSFLFCRSSLERNKRKKICCVFFQNPWSFYFYTQTVKNGSFFSYKTLTLSIKYLHGLRFRIQRINSFWEFVFYTFSDLESEAIWHNSFLLLLAAWYYCGHTVPTPPVN